MMNAKHLYGRRGFLKAAAACAASAALPGVTAAEGTSPIRAMLMLLGHNMWGEWMPEALRDKVPAHIRPDRRIRMNETYWRETVEHMVEKGLNMILIDIGEGLVFPSHPELAIEGSWSADKLHGEIVRYRKLGLEPIPKLNFSASHDGWLKDYHRMLTTPKWYEVAKDVVEDVFAIFERPRFFHLGWDEETVRFAPGRDYFVLRQGEMWWYDFLFTTDLVRSLGARPWVWSDYGWEHDEYFERCPKDVLQSNWYYDEQLGGRSLDPAKNKDHVRLAEFDRLERAGFDQVPCLTNWAGYGARGDAKRGGDDIPAMVAAHCREHISPSHLKGFLMAPWESCDTPAHRDFNIRGIDLFAETF